MLFTNQQLILHYWIWTSTNNKPMIIGSHKLIGRIVWQKMHLAQTSSWGCSHPSWAGRFRQASLWPGAGTRLDRGSDDQSFGPNTQPKTRLERWISNWWTRLSKILLEGQDRYQEERLGGERGSKRITTHRRAIMNSMTLLNSQVIDHGDWLFVSK